jgi:hypothetical protein
MAPIHVRSETCRNTAIELIVVDDDARRVARLAATDDYTGVTDVGRDATWLPHRFSST